jgi:Fe2+ transport system protein FeoA
MSRLIELGFTGGTVVRLSVEDAAADELASALDQGGWRQVEAEEGRYSLNVGEALYLRVESRSTRVGFGND